MRTVFVSQLAARVTDRELGIFFENFAGKVRDARVIVDKITRRSKGCVQVWPGDCWAVLIERPCAHRVGYVEFVELETVQKALTLSGTKLLGIPIQVQYTEAEKNRQAREGASGGGSSAPMTGGCVLVPPSWPCCPSAQRADRRVFSRTASMSDRSTSR
jgi:RNA-binding protein 39